MELKGEALIKAPRAVVWERLNDPATLQQCVPGCQSLTLVAPDVYEAVVVAVVGPVKATFKGKMTLADKKADEGYTLSGEGSGGVAGFGKMSARVTLADAEEGTQLAYTADAQVGGKLAQVGSRLVQGVAAKFAAEFFSRFNKVVAPETGA